MYDQIINSEKLTILDLFERKNIWFSVPNYQRPYVWTKDNIIQLLDDLWYSFEKGDSSEYFLGAIVLNEMKKDGYKEYEILDGQQRMITLMLTFAVIRDLTSGKARTTCMDMIYREQDEYKDIPERKRIEFNLKERKVDSFVDKYVIKELSTRNIESATDVEVGDSVTIRNMVKAIITIKKFFINKENTITSFLKHLNNKVVMIFISSTNKDDAFRMFTILNNRGIPLSGSDILKAINIGAITDEKERDRYTNRWEQIESDFGDSFDKFLGFVKSIILKDNLQKIHFLKSFEQEIYREGTDKEPIVKKGKETIRVIEDYKNIYDIVYNLEEKSIGSTYKNLLTVMKIGLNSEHWIPPLMSYYHRFNTYRLFDFLKLLDYKYAGDWIIGLYPTTRKENANKILKEITKISKEELDSFFKNDLFFSVDENKVKAILEGNFEYNNHRLARYLLLKYEYCVSEDIVNLVDFSRITIEHVLPKKVKENSEWNEWFTKREQKKWTNKLANLVLLSRNKNSKLSNLDFHEKKKQYFSGKVDIFNGSKLFLNNEKWTKDILEERQEVITSKLLSYDREVRNIFK